jgi:hypothetical protein
MRPNNQNKNRQRGRNGGRKHVNPLSRNYESNGPDVKVRGNAAHVAEKYLQLARDAQSSGDSVMAENYLQHAEHYFRIVSSAQQALNGQRDGQNQDEVDFDDDANDVNSRFSSPQPVQPVQAPQEQVEEAAPAEAAAPAQAEEAPVQDAAADGEQPQRKPRERRPRRRRPAGGEGAADPASADQPSVGELPAFLTGNPAE